MADKFIDIPGLEETKKEAKASKKKVKTKKKNYYLFILDASGSMSSSRDATIAGFNKQIETMKEESIKYDNQDFFVTLVTFSTPEKIHTVYSNISAKEVKPLTRSDYDPDGGTALRDAIGISVANLKDKATTDLKNKDTKVIFTIFTDGEENASETYSDQQIKDLIAELKASEKWTVAYVGASERSVKIAGGLGIAAGNTVRYDASSAAGYTKAFDHLSLSTRRYASMRSMSVPDAITEKQLSMNYMSETDDAVDLTAPDVSQMPTVYPIAALNKIAKAFEDADKEDDTKK